jgi:drug/metabolite transporter (DMT)-like permease
MYFLLGRDFKFRSLTKTHWLAGACYGALCLTYIFAMKLTTAANAIVLYYTAPIWVACLAPIFVKERVTKRDFLFMILIFGGVVIFFFDGLTTKGILGNLIALTGGMFYGLQAIFMRKLKDNRPIDALILGNILAFVIGVWAIQAPWPSPTGLLFVVILGIFQLGLPSYLYSLTISRVTSLELVLVTMLEPILCPLWVYIFIGEKPGRWAFLGAAVVITTVTWWSLLRALEDRKKPTALAQAGLGS